jgi:hypothetical protein
MSYRIIWVLGFSSMLSGCSALQAAQGGVQTGMSGVQQGQQTGDQLKGVGTSAKDLLTGKKDDPEGKGEDDDRLHAKEGAINTPLDDKLDNKKGDREDWRKFQLQGKPGVATFELFWDDEKSNLDIDVFDAFGVNIGRSPPRMEGQSVRRILVQITRMGTYYVRVKAPSEKDHSIYTLNVRWAGPPVVAQTPPPQQNPNPPAQAVNPNQTATPTAPVTLLTDPNKLQGNIISAYRDGPGWVLYIDKGSSQKVHQGMTGVILEGPEGEKLVDHGDFSISQVVDGNKSIARTNLKNPPGKNKRVVLNLR